MSQPLDLQRFAQLKAAGDLPSPRGVAIAIIRLTQSADVSMSELGRVIKGDPAFVGRLVKAANGLVGDGRRAVVSVQEALMVLGLPAVRTMALGFSLLSNYRKGACGGFDYVRFWSASLLMALSMQALAQRVRVVAADEAFSLGLLARIGELGLATIYPEGFAEVLRKLQRSPALRQLALEDEAFAMNHSELGAAMLADWGLPGAMVSAVRLFELPEAGQEQGQASARETGLIQCLVLARAVTQLCMAPEAQQLVLMQPMLRLASSLGIARPDFVSLCERACRDWAEWGKLLQIQTEQPPRFEVLLAEEAAPPAAPTVSTANAEKVCAGSTEAAPQMRALLLVAKEAEREILRTQLEGEGLLAVVPSSPTNAPAAAMEAVVDIQPQLLVLDWDDQGVCERLVRALRKTRLGRPIQIIALLPDASDALFVRVSESGADDAVSRPLRPAALLMRLRAAIRAVRLQRELEHEREELRQHAAELSISNRRLQEAALTDPLTGLPNRRQAIESMHMEWASSSRHNRPLSLMVLDLDDLKAINDAHGHDVGDMALRQCAEVLRAALRTQDMICRTGGDEFLVVCPDTDLDAALRCAERLRVAAEALSLETGGPGLRLTVSVGVAERDASIESVAALAKRADEGAYLAKQRGRNRVVAVQREALKQ